MPTGEPVNLAAAIVVFVIGAALGVGLLITVVREFRRRKALLAAGPDVSDFDRDLQRYTERVWLLVAEWRPRLDAEPAAQLDRMWDDVVERVDALRAARASGAETADDVAALVQAEKEVEGFIGASR